MNILLSCYASKGKIGYTLESHGKVVEKNVKTLSKSEDAKLKEYTLESIIDGLRVAKQYVNHEDLLLIGIQNAHMVDWLNTQKDYKGYEDYLDKIFDLVDTLDCKYLFAKKDMKKTKKILDSFVKKKEVLLGVDELFE